MISAELTLKYQTVKTKEVADVIDAAARASN
jgi:hypothetical protein